jgi:hypothetical protein
MIGYFDGDDCNPRVGTDYGDDYFAGERIIVDACVELGLFAKRLYDNDSEWGTVSRFDHRCFWLSLMLLNAVWRFREYKCQMNLPFDGIFEPENPEDLKERWFEWLRKETSTWVQYPLLVRQVLLILSNENQPIGYAAEARLADEILFIHGYVPWSKQIIRSIREQAARNLQP